MLISVLPVKHRFIRGLGIGRSVLIVDEVHAYDTYMNGLLEAVLKAQADVGECYSSFRNSTNETKTETSGYLWSAYRSRGK